MMWCDEQFNQFNDKLRLDSTRRGRIDSAVDAFAGFCAEDEDLSVVKVGAPFLQGSVATNTAIKPAESEEFDVDVVCPIDLKKLTPLWRTPEKAVDWFISRLARRPYYRDRLYRRPRCARINYAGDFHLDLIPATASLAGHQPLAVPARDLGDWATTNPAGFVAWMRENDARCEETDVSGDGRFVRAVRIMKRWRDELLGDHAPSSILLATLLGNHEPCRSPYRPPLPNPAFPTHRHEAAYLFDMLRITYSCLEDPKPICFENPTVPGEDLARGWDEKHLAPFMSRLLSCINEIARAVNASTESEAVTHYKKAFGDSFPG